MSLVIIDYGMGNLRSIQKKGNSKGLHFVVSSDLNEIEKADKLILPGVGHFGTAVENLKAAAMWDLLNHKVLEQKTPILGICLGMQLMAKSSEEGSKSGFGWFDADVVRFNVADKLKYKVPHIGWNDVLVRKENPLTKGICENEKFYFVHSYHLVSHNVDEVLAETEYEYPFVSAIWKNNIFGVQFHPEKSHEQGDAMLENFYKL